MIIFGYWGDIFSKNTKEDPSDIDEGVNNPALEPETQLNELKPKTVERLI